MIVFKIKIRIIAPIISTGIIMMIFLLTFLGNFFWQSGQFAAGAFVLIDMPCFIWSLHNGLPQIAQLETASFPHSVQVFMIEIFSNQIKYMILIIQV